MGFLYCVRSGDYIKVGYSTNPKKRLYSLRGAKGSHKHPASIQLKDILLEGRVPGSWSQERRFHRQFIHECVPGTTEWYPAGGMAHIAFGELPGYYTEPTVPSAPALEPLDPLENAIWIIETRKIELKIQWHRGPMAQDEINAWSILDSASEYLCKQL